MSAAIDKIMQGVWSDDQIGLLLTGTGSQGRKRRRDRPRCHGNGAPHEADSDLATPTC